LLQRSNKTETDILCAGIRYATCEKVWKDLGYDKTPVLGDPIWEPERALEIKKFAFMYRELFCMFVGGMIGNFAAQYYDLDDERYGRIYNEEYDFEVARSINAIMPQLPTAVQELCKITGMDFARADLDYYKRRIEAYAACNDEKIGLLFCLRYGTVIEPFDESFSAKVFTASSWLNTCYLDGYQVLEA
jgi:hypothetical protein